MDLLDVSTTVKSDRIHEGLDWSPQYSSYAEGLEQTLAIWKERGVIGG